MIKRLLKLISCLSLILFAGCSSSPSVSQDDYSTQIVVFDDDKYYRIYIPEWPYSSAYDVSDYYTEGIVKVGWGCEVATSLAVGEGKAKEHEVKKADRLKYYEHVEKDANWDAILPNGSIERPHHITEEGIAHFAIPYEMTGIMTIRATISDEIVATYDVVVVDTYINGDQIRGKTCTFKTHYYVTENGMIGKGWFRDEGNWYYSDSDGVMQFGWQYLNYNGIDNWYFFDGDGKMLTGWQRIGNSWYFFKSDGSMAANEWVGGYWLSANGFWKYHPKGSWKYDGKGWWFEDTSGWYPRNTTVKINGVLYSFNSRGYLVE